MTIKEFCEKYNKSEPNVRAKLNRNKEKLKDHITTAPYSKTITFDEYAENFLLGDQRGKSGTEDIAEKKAAPAQHASPPTANKGGLMYKHWSTEKKEKIMKICFAETCENYRALHYIPDDFKTYELCRYAVENQGVALQYIPACYVTEEICNIAVNNNSIALAFVPDKYKTQEMINTAFDNYKGAYEKVKGSISRDEESHLLKYVPEKFLNKDICMKAIICSHSNAEFIPRKYFDIDIIEEANTCSISRKYIPIEYWTREKIIETIKSGKDGYDGMFGIPRELFDFEFYMQLIDNKLIKPEEIYQSDYYSGILSAEEREIIREIDVKKHELSNKLHELIQQDSANIQLVSPDSEQYGLYALIAVCKCGEALKYVPMAKRNYILCEAAVEDDPNSIMYVPDEHKEKIIEGLKKRSDWLRYVFDFNNEKFSDSLIGSDSDTAE